MKSICDQILWTCCSWSHKILNSSTCSWLVDSRNCGIPGLRAGCFQSSLELRGEHQHAAFPSSTARPYSYLFTSNSIFMCATAPGMRTLANTSTRIRTTHDQTLPTNKKKTYRAFSNKRTFPTAGRCGSSLQYCRLPGTTQIRERTCGSNAETDPASAELLEKNFIHGDRRPASAPGPGNIFLFFPSACHSWQVQLRIESSCPMRRSEPDSARPGQDRLGSASLSPRRAAGGRQMTASVSSPFSIRKELPALRLCVPAFSLYHVHVTRSGLCQWKLKGTSHVMALCARSRWPVRVPEKQAPPLIKVKARGLLHCFYRNCDGDSDEDDDKQLTWCW